MALDQSCARRLRERRDLSVLDPRYEVGGVRFEMAGSHNELSDELEEGVELVGLAAALAGFAIAAV
jgi:hypothetical protein